MPARLVSGQLQDGPTSRIAGQAEIARGPLNEMVLLATDKEADESLMICLELAGNRMPLTWKDIIALRREPGFPVEI